VRCEKAPLEDYGRAAWHAAFQTWVLCAVCWLLDEEVQQGLRNVSVLLQAASLHAFAGRFESTGLAPWRLVDERRCQGDDDAWLARRRCHELVVRVSIVRRLTH
jgi:hypothetical protein